MTPLSELLQDHHEFHSDLQMDAFITARNGGTLYGCYKQALRELAARVRALRERYFAIELLKLEIAEHETAGTLRDQLMARQKGLALPEALHALQHTEREFLRFYAQCLALRGQLASVGVEFPLDAETRHRLDCEMWVHNIKCQAAVAAISGQRPSGNTLELIQSLPVALREQTLHDIFGEGSADKLVDWFLNYHVDLPIPAALPDIEPRRLVGCSE